MEDEKKKIQEIVPEEYFTGEDWLRAGRRRHLLLNVIYYLQHFTGKENGVELDDLSQFLEKVRKISSEIYYSVIKPEIPLEVTLNELLSSGLIIETDKRKFIINKEKVKSENDLIYIGKIKEVFKRVN